MNQDISRRPPRKLGGFSWGRFPASDTDIVAYRLFRRDNTGATHVENLHFHLRDQRRQVALALRAACHRLRDRVDEIDLVTLGVAA